METITVGKNTYVRHVSGFYFHEKTPAEVCRILAAAHDSRRRVRLFLGDTDTGKVWTEEYDVCGRIGASIGRLRAPLLIAKANSTGGDAILDSCIVGIAYTDTGLWAYRHPSLDLGTWTVGAPAEGAPATYRAAAYLNGAIHAQFRDEAAAHRYIAFMTGKRFAK